MSQLIERYVYAVTKELPEHQRDDIKNELYSLIEDMVDCEEGSNEESIKKVLCELGNPKILANNYQESKRYLIGPKYFNSYVNILKIVSFSVILGISIASLLGLFFSDDSIFEGIIRYFATLFQAILQGILWVTIIFAIAEYYDVDMKSKKEDKEWRLEELPEIPNKKLIISPFETLFNIIFTTVFMALLYSVPHLLAAYLKNEQGGYDVVSVFNIDVVKGLRWLIIAIYLSSLIKEIVKLIERRWTLKLVIISTVLSVISAIFSLLFFLNQRIWNVNFFQTIAPNVFDYLPTWDTVSMIIGIGIILGTLIEVGTMFYKVLLTRK